MENQEFVRTDDLQYQKSLSDTTFIMYGADELPEDDGFIVYSALIDVALYDEVKEDIITGYYKSIEEFEGYYEEHYRNGIFAECIFEQMSWSEASDVTRVSTEEEAEKLLHQLIEESK